MKKRLAVLFLVAMFTLPFDSVFAGQASITLACEDRENFPFVLGEGSDLKAENPGLSVEVLRLAAARLKISVNFTRLPWNRGKNALRYGKVDGLFNTGYTPEDRSIGVFPMRAGLPDDSRRMATVPFSIYTLKDSGLTWDGGYFNRKNLRVSVPMGFCVVSELRRMGLSVEESPGVSNCFRKLAYKRVDAVVAPGTTGDHLTESGRAEFSQVIRLEKPLNVQPFYLIFSHQFYSRNRDLAELIWDTVAELRESVAMKDLEKKYAGL
ncbi:MAG: transporter substrate-binding domain-containing protein [Deltaproteobacteria bacterium]|nr:transporter substrate-binding domain-containing protein [Deltaproteobacteria bacterium]